MGKTIIQPIGPLYGEPVNNTVYGRPNGSIYVPDTNRIVMNVKINYDNVYKDVSNNFRLCTSSKQGASDALKVYADSQDNDAYIVVGLYEDAECTTLLTGGGQSATKVYGAGYFNISSGVLFTKSGIEIVDETTYYLQATLYASTNVPIAVSEIVAIEAIE